MLILSSEERLLIRKIKNGTVIDHIPAGEALTVLRILGLTGKEGFTIALVMNVESKKLGKKDIVKVENKILSEDEVNKIALVAPTATINIVSNYKIIRKYNVQLPDEITNILQCINPTCITRRENEPIQPKFRVVSREINNVKLQCIYCGTIISQQDIKAQLTK